VEAGHLSRWWKAAMEDLGQALEAKVEHVVELWIDAVHKDSAIESARKLAYEAVRNSLPEVLKEMSALFSKHQAGDAEKLENKSLYHGFVRAQQGYDTAEIVREYRLLRQVILTVLEPELLTGTTQESLRAIRIIDSVLDEIITASLERYIEARLTELSQMQGQLILTNQELARLVQTQKENLSFMAHELKNPLNSIIGHSNILLQKQRKRIKEQGATTNLEQLEKVLKNGRVLLQIINNTLEISRYDQNQFELNLSPIPVGQLIQEIVEDGLEPLALEKDLALNIDISQSPEVVTTDPLRLRQLVINLVSNAIRYTNEGGVSIICSQCDDNSWELAVSDTGVGIASDQQARIFDPYVQADGESAAADSTGLGLAIVQRIVTLMKGTISVTSELGEGSTFTIRLPLSLSISQS
jgi:signal transduction histidine kinase